MCMVLCMVMTRALCVHLPCQDGQRDGVGVKVYVDGSTFDGFWRDGKKNGVGLFHPPVASRLNKGRVVDSKAKSIRSKDESENDNEIPQSASNGPILSAPSVDSTTGGGEV